MKSLVFERNLARFAAARVAASFGSGRGAAVGPLRLLETEPPALPGGDWGRVSPLLSGICGSDLATLDGRSSRYFEDIVSFPFVPGHEVVGVLDTAPGATTTAGASGLQAIAPGDRVVIEPVLGCAARGLEPPCEACGAGRLGNCERIAFGHLAPGLQTGYCTDTGGGWSAAGLVAHVTQLHRVPDELGDADAVMVEPTACAVHAVCGAGIGDGDTLAVLGAGTLGLVVVAAVTTLVAAGRLPPPKELLVGARYPHQRQLATSLGATAALPPAQLTRAVRRRSGSLSLGDPAKGTRSRTLTGGAHVVFDCVGSADSIAQSLSMVRPRGRVVLVGMPSKVHIDLASLWQREVQIAGAYAYGTETFEGATQARTFDLAFDVVAAHRLGDLVSATYPIDRFEDALAHAGAAGRRGAVKIAFDLQHGRRTAGSPGVTMPGTEEVAQ